MIYLILGAIYAYTGSLHFLVFGCSYSVCELMGGMIGRNDKTLHKCLVILAESIEEIKQEVRVLNDNQN